MTSERLRINILQFNLTFPQILTLYLIILTFLTLYDQCPKYDTSHHIKTLLYNIKNIISMPSERLKKFALCH